MIISIVLLIIGVGSGAFLTYGVITGAQDKKGAALVDAPGYSDGFALGRASAKEYFGSGTILPPEENRLELAQRLASEMKVQQGQLAAFEKGFDDGFVAGWNK